MARVTNGTAEEREQFMVSIFGKFYQDPANAGKDLSAAKANELFKAKYGSMLRNKKTYELREVAKKKAAAEHRGAGTAGRKAQAAGRSPQGEAGHTATLIEGTEEQLSFLKVVLEKLQAEGILVGCKVDHTAGSYVVVTKA